MNKKKTIINLTGPSGSGKTSMGEELKRMGIPELVSHTTRPMREGEVDGVSYYFITEEIFAGIEKIEYSNYAGNQYCVSKDELEKRFQESDIVFAVTDIDGHRQIKEQYPDETISIFMMVTYDEMVERMQFRGDAEENVAKRIKNAILMKEHDNYRKCDYVIRNRYYPQTVFELEQIVKKIRQKRSL